jgi:TRL-like protein family
LSTVIKAACALLAVLALGGCVERGILYSNTVEPYSEEFNATPIGTKSCVINSHEIEDPLTGYNISAEWTTNAILDAARKAGIREIHYIDKKTLSLFNGVYRRETLIVHGD